MAIWTAEIKELEKLHESLKGRLPDLEKELEQLIRFDDPNVILLYSRRCLEVIITDLCECELKRPRKTEPLKGIIDKLHKEEKVPPYIITSMHGLNDLSTYGTHPKDFVTEQIKPVLNNLDIIIKWYLKYKEPRTDIKAKPFEEIRQEIKSAENVKWSTTIPKKKLIGLISGMILLIAFVVAVLFFTKIIGGGRQTKEIEKSIAVLPFKLLSDEPDKQFLADGMMDAILLHLSKIKDLRVMPRTSVEQYQKTTKTAHVIGKELDVEYLLEGSFQKFGDNARLIVQLIKASKESHVWANEYNKNWKDFFSVQSEIAQTIAKELYATITPEEKELIEIVPTTNMTAYELYLKANDFLNEYQKTRDLSSYQKAATFYKAALEIDSTFAKAYTGLARANFNKFYSETYFKENFLDSCLVLVKKALSFDDKLDEAYYVEGMYYMANGHIEEALDNIDKALKINPNYYLAYALKGSILTSFLYDFVKGIDNYDKALKLIRGNERPPLLMRLGYTYRDLGFIDKAKYYYQEELDLDSNKLYNFYLLAWVELCNENFEEAYKLVKKREEIDSANYAEDLLILYSLPSGHSEEAYLFAKKLIEYYKKSGILNLYESHRIGYAFWQVGKYKEAKNYFNQQIKYDEESIKLNRNIARGKDAYYDLAATYAFLGNKVKAYKYLDEFNKMNFYPLWRVSLAKHDPLFANIRNEERFQKILYNMEAKNQAEHDRVAKWLEEQGMLN